MSYYMGIADAYGIESFIPEEEAKERLFPLKMRAMANRHRHAVVYRAEVSEDGAKVINRLLEKGEYEDALRILKKSCPEVEIMKEHGMAKSWGMIPDPSLDPYID